MQKAGNLAEYKVLCWSNGKRLFDDMQALTTDLCFDNWESVRSILFHKQLD